MQHCGVLTFAQVRQQDDPPIRKLKGVMMGVRLTFVDLSKPCHLLSEPPPREEPARLALDLRLKSKLGAGKHANGHVRVIHRDKAARNRVGKAPRYQLVTNLRRPGCDRRKVVVVRKFMKAMASASLAARAGNNATLISFRLSSLSVSILQIVGATSP